MDIIKKIIFIFVFLNINYQAWAQDIKNKIYVLGNIDQELKSLFEKTISNEIHDYARNISLVTNSQIYIFPYQYQKVWKVVSFHVGGDHHHKKIIQLVLQGSPLQSLDQIREIIGIDGSLKYIGWNSYTELPPEQILLASKVIAQNYIFLHI